MRTTGQAGTGTWCCWPSLEVQVFLMWRRAPAAASLAATSVLLERLPLLFIAAPVRGRWADWKQTPNKDATGKRALSRRLVARPTTFQSLLQAKTKTVCLAQLPLSFCGGVGAITEPPPDFALHVTTDAKKIRIPP